MPRPARSDRRRLGMLVLGLVVGVPVLVVVVLALGGVVIVPVLLALALLAPVALGHYVLWGRALSQAMETERQLEQVLDDDGWPDDGPHGPRRY